MSACVKELSGFRIKVDDRTEVTPGFKFNDWEMRGVPLRIEIGPKDVEKGTVALARRDMPGKAGKSFVPQTNLAAQVGEILQKIQSSLFERALAFRQANTYDPRDLCRAGRSVAEWLGLFLVVRKRRVRSKS